MIAVFLLRLSFGLLGALLLILRDDVNSRFYRVQFLTSLGLLVGTIIFPPDHPVSTAFWWVLGFGITACVLGSMSWMFETNPFGKTLVVISATLIGVLIVLVSLGQPAGPWWMWLGDHLTSAAVTGLSLTAMLLGHSYLVAPMMSIKPLQRLIVALGVAILLRVGISLYSLWLWRQGNLTMVNNAVVVWLAGRWLAGFILPLILGWMAWETSRIRSTQSATGILYVVTIFCVLGELTNQLLVNQTNLPL